MQALDFKEPFRGTAQEMFGFPNKTHPTLADFRTPWPGKAKKSRPKGAGLADRALYGAVINRR
jgi:hypothetical protein